ncbi:hypothetical protein K505DRAFT_291128 [Melanomma pulvis-pyrius CBS 109.77]|uniref:Protein kinase domain-containing protein n=1 Tax=Melanomma pulvis-pyrius CBS 109.77 TaxID=1314802 RepID=A0A6A6WNS5_9PLEO|nr:hypothetical protein K505DRAFT_291128 [Melanomma pulvis-pyrius CBS 109.77]
MQEGLLLDEANCGNLQSYIDSDDDKMNGTVRTEWSLQIAEAISPDSRRLWWLQVPRPGPGRAPPPRWASPRLDMFGLGMIIYIINTGQYPFRTRPAPAIDERLAHEDFAYAQLEQDRFPRLSGVCFGDVIAGP